jgi:hypothetical protein
MLCFRPLVYTFFPISKTIETPINFFKNNYLDIKRIVFPSFSVWYAFCPVRIDESLY